MYTHLYINIYHAGYPVGAPDVAPKSLSLLRYITLGVPLRKSSSRLRAQPPAVVAAPPAADAGLGAMVHILQTLLAPVLASQAAPPVLASQAAPPPPAIEVTPPPARSRVGLHSLMSPAASAGFAAGQELGPATQPAADASARSVAHAAGAGEQPAAEVGALVPAEAEGHTAPTAAQQPAAEQGVAERLAYNTFSFSAYHSRS